MLAVDFKKPWGFLVKTNAEARSPEVARRLWERTEEILASKGFAF